METIGETQIWSFSDRVKHARPLRNATIRKDRGHLVNSYFELATKVAELNFRNREHVLLFRGQARDHRNKGSYTTIKPTMFRPVPGSVSNPNSMILRDRFQHLLRAETSLLQDYTGEGLLGRQRLQRHRILRWAILQHYEVCKTPLLDVSQSLRVAASFASLTKGQEAFVYVIGVPNISGAVTASAEANVQIVRLASVCPPIAVRPHLQEGYLLGEYPEMVDFEQKQEYQHYEIDFGRRLVAKFRFKPKTFWKKNTFPRVGRDTLYPNTSDPLFTLTSSITNNIGRCP